MASKETRSFPFFIKSQCWEKARPVEGRNPARWRYDAVGNVVLRQLRGCKGALCHEYDHIKPYSDGGKSTLENCQVLQTAVNRFKSDKNPSDEEMIQRSLNERLSQREMDLIEKAIYGDIKTNP